MDDERAVTVVAYKMIQTFGGEAMQRMQAVVADHAEAADREGVEFWGGVARMVQRLQTAIEVGAMKRPISNGPVSR